MNKPVDRLRVLMNNLTLEYREYEHLPLETCQDADRFFVPRDGTRLKNLFLLNNVFRNADPRLEVIETFDKNTAAIKLPTFEAAGFEGVVLKSPNCAYIEGRSNHAVKFKFTKSLSAIVHQWSSDKAAVSLILKDAKGNPAPIGRVTIPANHSMPKIGSVIEVEYLYAHDSHALCQPVFQGLRCDVEESECVLSQLVFAAF